MSEKLSKAVNEAKDSWPFPAYYFGELSEEEKKEVSKTCSIEFNSLNNNYLLTFKNKI